MSVPPHERDPWTRVTSLHGFAADELVSALQKSIRRGMTENAALVALEMFVTSEALENHAWQRLAVISVEDVGFGNPMAPLIVHALDDFRKRIDRTVGDRPLYLIHAVRMLSGSPKDRSSDEMLNWIRQSLDNGTARPEIIDDFLDMHTRRGQEMGRDLRHFLLTGANVANELPDRDRTYRERLLAALEAESSTR